MFSCHFTNDTVFISSSYFLSFSCHFTNDILFINISHFLSFSCHFTNDIVFISISHFFYCLAVILPMTQTHSSVSPTFSLLNKWCFSLLCPAQFEDCYLFTSVVSVICIIFLIAGILCCSVGLIAAAYKSFWPDHVISISDNLPSSFANLAVSSFPSMVHCEGIHYIIALLNFWHRSWSSALRSVSSELGQLTLHLWRLLCFPCGIYE